MVDNCEHVLDQAADAIAQMLGAASQLCILATSRAPLDLPAESVLSLAPLGVPAAGDDPHRSASVLLFRQRCRDAGFEVVDGDIDTVAALCRSLDNRALATRAVSLRCERADDH